MSQTLPERIRAMLMFRRIHVETDGRDSVEDLCNGVTEFNLGLYVSTFTHNHRGPSRSFGFYMRGAKIISDSEIMGEWDKQRQRRITVIPYKPTTEGFYWLQTYEHFIEDPSVWLPPRVVQLITMPYNGRNSLMVIGPGLHDELIIMPDNYRWQGPLDSPFKDLSEVTDV